MSNPQVGSNVAMLGRKGIAGTDLGSTFIGLSEVTSLGDTAGLGVTDGGNSA